MIETTRDALLGGRIHYEQPSRGYRVGLEAPLLARFATTARAKPFRSVVDLGAGPGAVMLCLLFTGWAAHGTAVEIDRAHAALAIANAAHNALSLDVICADVAQVSGIAGDLVIMNPPWFEPTAGAVASDPTRGGARAFVRGTLQGFIAAARRALAPRGRAVLSMPAARLVDTVDALARTGLHAKRMRFVHPRAGGEADVVFVEAKPGRAGGLVVERPLFVRAAGEDYTPEARETLFTAAWGRGAAAARSSARASERDPA